MDKFPDFTLLGAEVGREIIMASAISESIGMTAVCSLADIPVFKYTVPISALIGYLAYKSSENEAQKLSSFFISKLGQAGRFLFVDPISGNVKNKLKFGHGGGGEKNFTLIDPDGLVAKYPESVSIYFKTHSDYALASPSSYSISENGKISFVDAPGNRVGLYWTGVCHKVVRFSESSLKSSKSEYYEIMMADDIILVADRNQ